MLTWSSGGTRDNTANIDGSPRIPASTHDIKEALGIKEVTPTVNKSQDTNKALSPWTNFRKRWSITPAPQREAPVEIKSRGPPKAKATDMPKRPRKKKPKSNTAMAKLTRLASTKISMIADPSTFADLDELQVCIPPSDQPSQDEGDSSAKDFPSSLPYVPDDQRQVPHTSRLTKVRPGENPSSEYSSSADFFSSTEWSGFPEDPFSLSQARTENRNSSAYLGYSASKPELPRFMPPPRVRRPLPEKAVNPSRHRSTFEYYSGLTGGPSYHEYVAENRRKDSLGQRQEYRRRGSRDSIQQVSRRQTSKFAPNDHIPGNPNNEYDARGDREQSSSIYNGVQRFREPSSLPYYRQDKGDYPGTPTQLRSRESSTYEQPVLGYPKTEFKGKRKSPVFHPAHVDEVGPHEDVESRTQGTEQRRNQEMDGGAKQQATESSENPKVLFEGGPRPMYRRSSSGHISFTIPDISETPPHDSPFADYTKHGVKQRTSFDKQTGAPTETSAMLVEARTHFNEEQNPVAVKPPRPTRANLENIAHPEASREGEQKLRFRRSSSGHISFTIPDTSETPPHDSPFADYTKHGAKDRPREQASIDEKVPGELLNAEASTSGQPSMKPSDPSTSYAPPSKFIITGKSPWASETGDPSHDDSPKSMNSVEIRAPVTTSQPSSGNPGVPVANSRPAPATSTAPERIPYPISGNTIAPESSPDLRTLGNTNEPVKILRQSKLIEYEPY